MKRANKTRRNDEIQGSQSETSVQVQAPASEEFPSDLLRTSPKNVDYRQVLLRELRVITRQRPRDGREMAVGIEVRGDFYWPTPRFWSSLFHRFGVTGNIFRYFRYDEVFARVVDANPESRVRLCAENYPEDKRRLLAVSSPRRPVLRYEEAMHLLSRRVPNRREEQSDADLSYHNGVITSSHVPRSGEYGFDIGPDRFNHRFVVEVPVDGFGQPRIYLSLLRQICSNGAIGYSRAFRSDIRLGEDAAYTLDRALGQFDHEEGFAALRQRFESAQKSWASLHEVLSLQKLLAKIPQRSDAPRWQDQLDHVAGDLHTLYGLANLQNLSAKRQRVLPARCRVYDLLNFASEIATHRATVDARTRLQAYIGSLISDEYDLEGTAEKVPQFKDLFHHLN